MPDETILAGSRINMTGVIVQKQNTYAIWPVTLIIDPPILPAPLPPDREDILSVVCLNVRQFGSVEPGFAIRAEKLADFLREEAGYPDIIAFQEIKDRGALNILSDIIGETPEGVTYIPYIDTGSGNSDIHNAYLYKPCFSELDFKRLGLFESLSLGGRLHDRPPLLMEFLSPHDSSRSFRILNVHLRSLIGIEGSNANFVRRKRHEQAVSIARMIEQLPEEDPLLVLGDFNAFPFSDGYVDIFAQISGKKSLGALLPPEMVLSDSLDSPLLGLPEQEQYSYIFNGHSQLIDHLLTRNSGYFSNASYYMLRGNADVPPSWELDPGQKWRFSDHDGFLVHFTLPVEQQCEPETEIVEKFDIRYQNPGTAGDMRLTISSPKKEWIMLDLYDLSGKQVISKQLWAEEGSQEISMEITLPSGIYLLRIQAENSTITGKWVIH
jgi:endonuclease/exonuclease/phosphatase family metal-dependent hydrolase